MYPVKIIFLMGLLLMACGTEPSNMKHIFYLHGMIIETQGTNAESPEFGRYLYQDILDSLKGTGAVLHAVVRTADTDFEDFCRKTSGQIDELTEDGVKPGNITIIGAFKGAIIAMNIANSNAVNYVLLVANIDRLEQENDWNLNGNILAIYESSDTIAGKDYQYWIDRSTHADRFEQLELHTGLNHGFLYRPIPECLNPVKNWMSNEKK